jgi:hypothetical protein
MDFRPYCGTLRLSDVEIKTFYEGEDGRPNSRKPNWATAKHLPTGIVVDGPIMESMAFTRGYLIRALEQAVSHAKET